MKIGLSIRIEATSTIQETPSLLILSHQGREGREGAARLTLYRIFQVISNNTGWRCAIVRTMKIGLPIRTGAASTAAVDPSPRSGKGPGMTSIRFAGMTNRIHPPLGYFLSKFK